MITPSKKLFYAIEAVLYIAYHAGEHPVSSRDIARQQGLPSRYLEQIMQKLVHGGVLRGVRGPRGGYVLAAPLNTVSLKTICKLVDDEDVIGTLPPTTPLGDIILRPFWETLAQSIQEKLSSITIHDLYNEAITRQIQKI